MPLFGAHLSIAGGLYKAVAAAVALGMDTVQLFTHSPSQWAVPASGSPRKPLADADVAAFRQALAASALRYPTAHDSYLINLASPDPGLYRRSIEAFVGEVERAEALGLAYLVTHPGTPTDGDDPAGLERIARALDEVHGRCPDAKVQVLLETTAGQGKNLGHRFEHLAELFARVAASERLGVCVDTCHVFAAGYHLAPEDAYHATLTEFDRIVGIARLKLFHLNDSVKPHGSRVDRHAGLGLGQMGLEAFRLLVNDPRFRAHPMILETPKEDADGNAMDPVNLRVLRALIEPTKKGKAAQVRKGRRR